MNVLKRVKLAQHPNELNLVIPGIKNPICYKSVLQKVMEQDVKAAGVPPLTPHGLRHTFATYLLSPAPFGLGQNVRVVSEMLGHSNPTTTWNTYSHTLPKMQETVAEMFDNALDFKA
jgi:integrase